MSDAVKKYLVWLALCACLILGLVHAEAYRGSCSPDRISGLTMWLDAEQSTKFTCNAAVFGATSSESLSASDNTALSMGDIDFSIGLWYRNHTNFASAGNTRGIAGKWQSGDLEYLIFEDNTAGTIRFKFSVRNTANDTTTTVTADTFGTPSTVTWYLVQTYHDSNANTIGIAVNNGSFDTQPTTGGVRDGTANFVLGSHTAANYLNARMQSVGIWKKVLSAGEWTALYNGGSGLSYSLLTSVSSGSLLTSLVGWWDLFEYSGNRSDRLGVTTLTDNNTVPNQACVASATYPSMSGDPVMRWSDISGTGNHVTQDVSATGEADAPIFDATTAYGKTGQKAIVFDGTDDLLILNAYTADFTGSDKPVSMVAVVSNNGVTGNDSIASWGSSASANQRMSFELTNDTLRIQRTDDGNNSDGVSSGTITTGTPYLVSFVFTGTAGSTIVSGTSGILADAQDLGALTLNRFNIGARTRTTVDQFWNGEFHEIAIFNKALSLRERKYIERCMAKKWRVTGGLTK